jgi:hypothetical protein
MLDTSCWIADDDPRIKPWQSWCMIFKEASEAAFRVPLYHPEGSGRERSKWHFQDAIECEYLVVSVVATISDSPSPYHALFHSKDTDL